MADEKKDLGACDRAWEWVKSKVDRCCDALGFAWRQMKGFGLVPCFLLMASAFFLALLVMPSTDGLLKLLDKFGESGPAWVQAVGSIGAILVAIYISTKQERGREAREIAVKISNYDFVLDRFLNLHAYSDAGVCFFLENNMNDEHFYSFLSRMIDRISCFLVELQGFRVGDFEDSEKYFFYSDLMRCFLSIQESLRFKAKVKDAQFSAEHLKRLIKELREIHKKLELNA